MSKRKIFALISALFIVCMSCSCSDDSDAESKSSSLFVIVESGYAKGKDVTIRQKIMYDPETMVMYTYMGPANGGGLTPIYNADGTLKRYSPEE